jgi:hypothetical protein
LCHCNLFQSGPDPQLCAEDLLIALRQRVKGFLPALIGRKKVETWIRPLVAEGDQPQSLCPVDEGMRGAMVTAARFTIYMDAHVIRTAGGRASDAAIRSLLASSLETAVLGDNGFTDVGEGPGSTAGDCINWLTIRDPRQSVIDDVRRIREHPLAADRIPIHGFIDQVQTGQFVEVQESTALGAPPEVVS